MVTDDWDDRKRFIAAWAGDLEEESDRAAPILAVAMLEELLDRLIRTRIRGGRRLSDKLLEGQGALATFSARIDGVYAFGLISADERNDLHLIRRVRNRFAHEPESLTFRDQEIVEWSRSLECGELFADFMGFTHPSEPRRRFLNAVAALAAILELRADMVGEVSAPRSLTDVARFWSLDETVEKPDDGQSE